jgi:hypothetical protein
LSPLPLLIPAPRELELRGEGAPRDARAERRHDASLPPQGYALEIDASGIRLSAGDRHGLRHGEQTLAALREQGGARLPGLRIRDWPDFAERGYMLDVSRDRVPTMASLRALVDLLARLRINQLQLYTEHTFAYRAHERVWRDASPLTHDEIRALDACCAAHGIELVPNQNSFGHMERWLRHEPYRALAELPERRGARVPSCLAPDAAGAAFVIELYRELLPCFASRRINIGCDETFELGQGRSRERCERLGRERVYLEFVSRLCAWLHERGRQVQLWGDILGRRPDLARELPGEVAALVWGYEAPMDPASLPADARDALARLDSPLEWLRGFDARIAPYREAGVPVVVCPGTSGWNSLLGRLPNALGNLRDAAESGLRAGARGMLITDWGDHGHWQPPLVSLAPLVYGASVAWCGETNRDLALEPVLVHLLGPDAALAPHLVRLGALHAGTGLRALNATPFFLALLRPLDADPGTIGTPERAALERTADALDAELRAIPGDSLPARELRQAAALARHGTWRLLRRHFAAGPAPAELRRDLEARIAEQRALWLERSRPGGLPESLARLESRLSDYER